MSGLSDLGMPRQTLAESLDHTRSDRFTLLEVDAVATMNDMSLVSQSTTAMNRLLFTLLRALRDADAAYVFCWQRRNGRVAAKERRLSASPTPELPLLKPLSVFSVHSVVQTNAGTVCTSN